MTTLIKTHKVIGFSSPVDIYCKVKITNNGLVETKKEFDLVGQS